MPVTPDTKNWTWVLERPCPECGYDASLLAPGQVADQLRAQAQQWPAVLARSDVRVRPDDSTWSALEYAAHVRDVCRVYTERVGLMVSQDDPLYPNWDQDATAVADRYNEQDPTTVGGELVDAASALARSFDTVSPDGWQRPGRRSDGQGFTVASISLYFLHDVVHHYWDVTK